MKCIHILPAFFIATLFLQACSLTDFTEVDNPNVTEDNFIGLEDAPEQTLNGLERQIALTLNHTIQFGEILSDNYFNNRTLSSKVFDKLVILNSDQDVRKIQQQIHSLRELALLGIEKIVPAHPSTSEDIIAEYYFFKGMSELYAGEYFTYLPASSGGTVLNSQENLQLAVEDFEMAISRSSDDNKIVSYKIAQLRALYNLRNKTEALSLATELTSVDDSYYRSVQYDGTNGLTNAMQSFLFDSNQNEFAPLPSLDFLDPKYYYKGTASTEQKEVAYLKIEEVYLIKAEAELSGSQLPNAKSTLIKLLDVINQRPTDLIDDSKETRNGGNRESFFSDQRGSYPMTSDYVVSFAGNDKAYSNLILDRQAGLVKVYTISGTSVTSQDINEASTEEDLLYLLYKMRQEIFIAEGRRVIDLGIKLQVADFEAISNNNVIPEHQEPQIPAYIKAMDLLQYPLDNFTNDAVNKKVIIDYDFTKLIISNRETNEVVPFF